MTKYQPMRGRVLVAPDESRRVRPSGIVLIEDGPIDPDSVRTGRARVLAVGAPRLNRKTGQPMEHEFKVGDFILFADAGHNSFDLDGQKCLLVNDLDVLAVLEESP